LVKCCHWHDSVDGVSFAQGHILQQIQTELTKVTRDRQHAIETQRTYESYGVATVVAQLVDAILRDESGCLQFPQESAYGVGNEVVLGLPCIIGKHGIESCLVLPRNEVEQCRQSFCHKAE